MPRPRMTDPTVQERIQRLLAAGTPKETIATELGISKQTLYAWLEEMGTQMQSAVAQRKSDYAARLVETQFSLYDELARMATILQSEIAALGQLQRQERTEQRALAIFRGATVVRGYLERMGELLGQLQPQPAANVHLTRIEQLLQVRVDPADVPAHLRPIVQQATEAGHE